MITKYGYDVFFTIAGICIALILVALFLIEPRTVKYSIIAVALLFFGFTANFFRDPDRTPPSGDALVLSPADGKVIVVQQAEENEFLKAPAYQISIFMSPLNVHVNRNPISGQVAHYRYIPGEYFAAFEDKASEKNEHTVIGMENHKGKVLFKQIAGFVARRIVCTLKVGDTVKAGDRFGMIKFGSRVDVFVPASATPKVRPGDRAVAGETILAELPD
ncbi:MAG: phosphatidylserine decarboxylase family protein [Ignavibacteriales bacterium]|nr:phosphatidylserine decarboxylase family protein [Ignavibacteriales bacterium]